MTTSAGAVVWLTGLPASGKSTLALAVRDRLHGNAVMLDSDALREVLGATGYGPADRDAFYTVLGRLATLLADQGHVVLVAATAPRRAYRDALRTTAAWFLEVHVAASRAVCEGRDAKGLYERARAGQAPTLPGVGDDYEPPLHPDVVATGGHDHVAVATIVALIQAR